jgi:Flp pilus assembly protein TadD
VVTFWTVATVMVVLATTAVVAPMFWLRSADERNYAARRLWSTAAVAALVPLAALGLYAWLGSPWLAGAGAGPFASIAAGDAAAPPHHGAAPGNAMSGSAAAGAAGRAGAGAGDLGAAVERLEARLAAQPQDPPGWELLAQSYEFQGRTEDAAGARQRRLPASRGPASSSSAVAVPAGSTAARAATTAAPLAAATLAAVAARLPSGSDALAQQAQDARRARDFPRAIAAFQKLAKEGALDAGLWADYADATAAQRGSLDEVSEPMIRQALALEPAHPKALWLLGSLQVQRRDFAAALQTWQRLQGVMPPDSSDARLIAENIVEARTMLGAAAPASGAVANVAVSGDIDLDARWRGKVPAQTVLYVFAKAVGQPGPPVAVLRTTAGAWPRAFVLDDSLAMMPGRTLSSARSVIVEARLSRSGSATPQPGDLRGSSAALDPRNPGRLRIVIAEEIR